MIVESFFEVFLIGLFKVILGVGVKVPQSSIVSKIFLIGPFNTLRKTKPVKSQFFLGNSVIEECVNLKGKRLHSNVSQLFELKQ